MSVSIVLLVISVAIHFAGPHLFPEWNGMSRAILVWNGEYWRLVTAIFLHGGFLHLALNMYGLYYLGPVLERQIGIVRFLVIYFVAGIYGFLISLVFLEPMTPTLGASGSIFGLIGALIGSEMRFGRHPLAFLEHDYGRNLMGFILINLVIGFSMPGINNAAHLGGLVAGLLLTQVGLLRLHRKPDRNGWLLRGAAAALAIELAIYSLFPVFNGHWQLNRARAAQNQSQPEKFDFALKQALRIDRELVQKFMEWPKDR